MKPLNICLFLFKYQVIFGYMLQCYIIHLPINVGIRIMSVVEDVCFYRIYISTLINSCMLCWVCGDNLISVKGTLHTAWHALPGLAWYTDMMHSLEIDLRDVSWRFLYAEKSQLRTGCQCQTVSQSSLLTSNGIPVGHFNFTKYLEHKILIILSINKN